jgi:hypothetical protein
MSRVVFSEKLDYLQAVAFQFAPVPAFHRYKWRRIAPACAYFVRHIGFYGGRGKQSIRDLALIIALCGNSSSVRLQLAPPIPASSSQRFFDSRCGWMANLLLHDARNIYPDWMQSR